MYEKELKKNVLDFYMMFSLHGYISLSLVLNSKQAYTVALLLFNDCFCSFLLSIICASSLHLQYTVFNNHFEFSDPHT